MGKTSTEVKRRYNEKVYSRLYLMLPKDLVSAFKKKCVDNGVSYSSVLRNAIEEYIKK